MNTGQLVIGLDSASNPYLPSIITVIIIIIITATATVIVIIHMLKELVVVSLVSMQITFGF